MVNLAVKVIGKLPQALATTQQASLSGSLTLSNAFFDWNIAFSRQANTVLP